MPNGERCMEFQQGSSKLENEALPPTFVRNLSSSSSAFFSAIQSPFFSPRTIKFPICEIVQLESSNSSNYNTKSSSDPLGSRAFAKQLQSSSNADILTSDDFGTPSAVLENFEFHASSNCFRDGGSSSDCSNGTSTDNLLVNGRRVKLSRSQLTNSFDQSSASISSSSKTFSYDVYIGFHGRKPSLLRFANWLRAELEVQGIQCFVSDRARCRNPRSHDTVARIMNSCALGVVILTRKSFSNPYSIEELRNFLGRKILVAIFFDLHFSVCLARDVIEKRGELWERDGGELWLLYGGEEEEWREAVGGLSLVLDSHLEASDGNWRDCIFETVILLATRLGRRSVVERIKRWKERVEEEEFPFPRNEEFVGRERELSEIELLLFGYVSGDGERELFEIKSKRRKKSSRTHQQAEDGSKSKEIFRNVRRKRFTRSVYGKGIACVTGKSGIGKTELALEYAYRFSQRYKMVLWVGGEARYIKQNFLNLRYFLDVDQSNENCPTKMNKVKSFEEQERVAIDHVREALMHDIPFLVVIDNLENEKDWWDQELVMDLLPQFRGEIHIIITTRLPRFMDLELIKLSYLSGLEAMSLMKGNVKDYPIMEINALRAIEEKLGRLTLGLGIVGAILFELPITPSKLLDTINRTPIRDSIWSDGEAHILRQHPFLMQLFDVCLSIFDYADGSRSLAARMLLVSSWFGPTAIPIPLLAMAAHKVPGKYHGTETWHKFFRALTCRIKSTKVKISEIEASSILVRFGIARFVTKYDAIHFHEIIKLYARKRGSIAIAQAVVQAISQTSFVSLYSEHQWAACFLLFGFGTIPIVVNLKPSELLLFVKHVALPLAVHTFIKFSRCNAALELLRLCADALDAAAETMISRADKWLDRSFCCQKPNNSDNRYTYIWQELALLKARVLEVSAKLMLQGGEDHIAEDLFRQTIYIRKSIYGEYHADTVSAQETLNKLGTVFINMQVS
ncbi:putative AAA+ ATPase domain, P-loop containing nucleoside triphosphate hydrolase, TIR [Dioscorea sansibarensis]